MRTPVTFHKELKRIAARKGSVQWFPSGVIEQLIFKNGEIYARSLVNKSNSHLIHPRPEHWCREVERTELVRVGDLMPMLR